MIGTDSAPATATSAELDLPTRVIFGRGTLSELGARAAGAMARPLLVSGARHAADSGLLDRTCSLLADAGLDPVVAHISAEPDCDVVDCVGALIAEHGRDGLIAVGGGSALDAAKAASVTGGRPARKLLGVPLGEGHAGLPVIAVPTTGGTGAEVTRGALIVDPSTGAKAGVRGRAVAPRLALVDPELIADLPWELIVDTGFDAFAHGVEGLLARRSNELTRGFALQALTLAAELLAALDAPRPLEPAECERLCAAGVNGGLSVSSASTCLPHRLQQAMAGAGEAHGRGLLRLYPAWWARVQAAAPPGLARIDAALGGWRVEEIVAHVTGLVPLRPLSSECVARWVVAVTGNLDNDPLPPLSDEELGTVFRESL